MTNDNSRKLSYSLKHPEVTNEVTSGDLPQVFTPNIFPVDPNERTTIGLHLSLNEFIQIATAIDVGRDIAYGGESISVWDLWANILREYAVINCDDVANCIVTSESVQTAITNEYQSTVNEYLEQGGFVNPDTSSSETTIITRLPTYSEEEVASPPEQCDLDKLWSGIREIVVRIDDGGRDVLEDLTLINDKAEQIQGLIDLVPLLGDIIADVSKFFTQAVPDLLNGYNAFSSEAEIDNLACELFSLVCSECRYPTFEEVMKVYSDKSVAGLAVFPQLKNYSEVWNAVKAVPALNGSIVYHTINTWQLVTYFFNSKFGRGRGKNILNIWASLGEDLPTDNWLVLCGECENNCDVDNFVSSQSGWTKYVQLDGRGYGDYEQGVGWTLEKRVSSNSGYITIEKAYNKSGLITASMTYDSSNSIGAFNGEASRIQLFYQGNVVKEIGGISGAGTNLVKSGSYDGDIDNVQIVFACFPNKAVTLKEFSICVD